MISIQSILEQNRIIAACKPDNLEAAFDTNASGIILMNGKLSFFLEYAEHLSKCPKPLFIHTDLIRGLSHDRESMKFISEYIKPAGIVSTKGSMIRTARNEGLLSIMRVFLIDTSSLKNSIKHIKESNPDAIEIMPGIAPEIIQTLRKYIEQPIILGGLIWNKKHIKTALEAGADAVSLSKNKFWELQLK